MCPGDRGGGDWQESSFLHCPPLTSLNTGRRPLQGHLSLAFTDSSWGAVARRWTARSPCGWVLPPSGQLHQQAGKSERGPRAGGCPSACLFVCLFCSCGNFQPAGGPGVRWGWRAGGAITHPVPLIISPIPIRGQTSRTPLLGLGLSADSRGRLPASEARGRGGRLQSSTRICMPGEG